MTLNGIYLPDVHADTGSEVDLIEESLAKGPHFWSIRLDHSDPHEIELFDGRRVPLVRKVSVQVRILPSALNSNQTSPTTVQGFLSEANGEGTRPRVTETSDVPQQRMFYVSRGLEERVVIGQELLDSMDAFNRCILSGKPSDCATPTFKVPWCKPKPPGKFNHSLVLF